MYAITIGRRASRPCGTGSGRLAEECSLQSRDYRKNVETKGGSLRIARFTLVTIDSEFASDVERSRNPTNN